MQSAQIAERCRDIEKSPFSSKRVHAISSPILQTSLAIPAAIAGVTLNEECTRQKLYQAKCKDKAAFRFSSFFEKAFVSRVNLRSCIRIVKFWRSICDVEICCASGSPITGIGTASTIDLTGVFDTSRSEREFHSRRTAGYGMEETQTGADRDVVAAD